MECPHCGKKVACPDEQLAQCSTRKMDDRVAVIRRRVDYLRSLIDCSTRGARGYEEEEHAALTWALAELSGIGKEIRREKAGNVSTWRKAVARAERAEGLNAKYRETIRAMKAAS